MFEELYAKIEKKLIDNDINETSVIKDYCDEMVKKTFRKMLPSFESYMGSAEGLISECSKNLANAYDASEEEVYDGLTKELDELVPTWRKYLDINNLANSISDVFVNQFYKNKYSKDKDENVTTFDEAVNNTINRNVEFGYKIESKKDMEGILRKLFHEYFDKGNVLAFTSRNQSRNYVSSRSKKQILEEMMKTANINSSLPATDLEDQIREEYINVIASSVDFSSGK